MDKKKFRRRRKKLYKFLGFYKKDKKLIGRMEILPVEVYFKKIGFDKEWAGIFFVGEKEKFRFLTLQKEPTKKYYKSTVLDVEFYLVEKQNTNRNRFDYILYISYVGTRKSQVNGKVISYNMHEFIFADTLE